MSKRKMTINDAFSKMHINERVEKTFTICTTGIADNTSGSIDSYELGIVNIFLFIMLPNILSRIPPIFTRIIISHHDIMFNAKRDKINIPDIVYTINYRLSSYMQNVDSRIVSHTFTTDSLNIDELISVSHLVIDWAHIYDYLPGHTIIRNDAYDYSMMKKPLGIRALYPNWFDSSIAELKLFEISPTGEIITYIDCLENAGFIKQLITNPIEFIEGTIIWKIKSTLMEMWRSTKGGIKVTEAGGRFDEIYYSYQIFEKVLDKLFANETSVQILDITTYDFYKHFIEMLDDKDIF